MVRTKTVVKTKQQSDINKPKPKKAKGKKKNQQKQQNTEQKQPFIGGGLPKIKKPHRFRPGTVAKREIKKYSNSVADLIPHAPFQKLCRDIAGDIETSIKNNKGNLRFQKNAILALKSASQDFLNKLFEDSNMYAKHAKRETVFVKDIGLFLKNQPDFKHYNSTKKARKLPAQKIIQQPKKKISNEENKLNEEPINEEPKLNELNGHKLPIKKINKELNGKKKLLTFIENKELNGKKNLPKKEPKKVDQKNEEEEDKSMAIDGEEQASQWKFTF